MNPQKDVKLQILTASTVLTRSSPLEVLLLLLIVSICKVGSWKPKNFCFPKPGSLRMLASKCLMDWIKNEQGTTQSVFFYYYYFH